MCPLRLILIFLSAMLAGFFVIRNLKSEQPLQVVDADADADADADEKDVVKDPNANKVSKAFWTCVDMASGRYLWRHLLSSSSKRSD